MHVTYSCDHRRVRGALFQCVNTMCWQVSISVKANAPAKLIPLEPHGVPTVSNTHSTSCRCIVRFLKLQLQDRHGNHFSNGLSGEVVVTVVGPKDEPDVPLLAGSEQSLTVHMRNGQVTLQVFCRL